MNLDSYILAEDRLVTQTLRRYPRLESFVHFYNGDRYEELYGERRNNVVPILATYLLPGLLAYHNFITRSHNLLELQEQRGSSLRNLFRCSREDIRNWLNQLFYEVNQVIPAISPMPPGSRLDIRPQLQLKQSLAQRMQRTQRRRNSPVAYFWTTVNMFYKNTQENQVLLIPDPQNLMQLIPFSREQLLRLETVVKSRLERFCIRHKAINVMPQEAPIPGQFSRVEPEPVRTTRIAVRDFGDSEEVDAPEDIGYSACDLAEEFNFPANAKEIIAKDLFIHSMALESWENMTYYSTDTNRLEYLPYSISVCRFITEAYQQLFTAVHAGNTQQETLRVLLGISFNFYISNVHVFLRGIYQAENQQGETQLTESATIILEGLRKLRTQNPLRLITPRGSNIWQKSICEQFTRNGKRFY